MLGATEQASDRTHKLWRESFEQNGYLVVGEVISPPLLKRLKSALAGITRGHAKLEPYLKGRIKLLDVKPDESPRTVDEGHSSSVKYISDLLLFGIPFRELVMHASLLNVLESILGGSEFSFRYAGFRSRRVEDAEDAAPGEFHREGNPFWQTAPNGAVAMIPLDDMDAGNGGTRVIPGSHRVSDEEVMQEPFSKTEKNAFDESDVFTPDVAAGSVLFLSYKILHASGRMESGSGTRNTILMDWTAPGVLPTSFVRRACDGLRPRSKLPEYQRQIKATFATYSDLKREITTTSLQSSGSPHAFDLPLLPPPRRQW